MNIETCCKKIIIKIGVDIILRKEKGKILIEGMDLSGKTTITKYLSEIMNIDRIQQRTLSDENSIFDFTVAQSKKGKLHPELMSYIC